MKGQKRGKVKRTAQLVEGHEQVAPAHPATHCYNGTFCETNRKRLSRNGTANRNTFCPHYQAQQTGTLSVLTIWHSKQEHFLSSLSGTANRNTFCPHYQAQQTGTLSVLTIRHLLHQNEISTHHWLPSERFSPLKYCVETNVSFALS